MFWEWEIESYLQWADLAFIVMSHAAYAYKNGKRTLFIKNMSRKTYFLPKKTNIMAYVFRMFMYICRDRDTSKNDQLSPNSQDDFFSSIYLFILTLNSYEIYVRKRIHHEFAQKASSIPLVIENQTLNLLKLIKSAYFLSLVKLIMPS